jgi:hypothetical protein
MVEALNEISFLVVLLHANNFSGTGEHLKMFQEPGDGGGR